MPDWDQRVRDHGVTTSLAEIKQELDQTAAPDNADANDKLERIRHVVNRLGSLLEDSDSELLAPELLDDANYHLPDLLDELRKYRETGDVSWLDSASTSIVDELIPKVGWPLAYVAADPAGLRDAAANYRRSAGQLLRGVEEDAQAARARVGELEQAIAAARRAWTRRSRTLHRLSTRLFPPPSSGSLTFRQTSTLRRRASTRSRPSISGLSRKVRRLEQRSRTTRSLRKSRSTTQRELGLNRASTQLSPASRGAQPR